VTGPTTAGRWTKLYASLINGRALTLSRDARLLAVEAEAWADDQETDGLIPRGALRRITDADEPEALAAELLGQGYWQEAEGGWSIVGFLDRHDDSDRRAEKRAYDAARQQGYRDHATGRHHEYGPRTCERCRAIREGARHTVTDDVTNAVRSGVRHRVDAMRSDAKRSDASHRERSRSASAAAPASARSGQGRAPSKAEHEAVEAMLEGELCWFCANPAPPGDLLMETKRPVGRLGSQAVHRGECDPLPFEGWDHCGLCAGAMPLAWLHDPDPDDDEGEGYLECRPGRGCGGSDAEAQREAKERHSAERECPGCGETWPGSAFQVERTVVMEDGSEVRALVCGDCDLRARYPERYGSGDDAPDPDAGEDGGPGPAVAEEEVGPAGQGAEDAPVVGDTDGGADGGGGHGASAHKGVEGQGGDVVGGQGGTSEDRDADDGADRKPGSGSAGRRARSDDRRRKNLR